jgi:hypothetical protein
MPCSYIYDLSCPLILERRSERERERDIAASNRSWVFIMSCWCLDCIAWNYVLTNIRTGPFLNTSRESYCYTTLLIDEHQEARMCQRTAYYIHKIYGKIKKLFAQRLSAVHVSVYVSSETWNVSFCLSHHYYDGILPCGVPTSEMDSTVLSRWAVTRQVNTDDIWRH